MHKNKQPKSIDATDLPLSITAANSTPRYLQVAHQLQSLIQSRQLPPRTKLPSTRALARALGLNRNTILAAFAQLMRTGHLETHGRHGTQVSSLAFTSQPKTATRPVLRDVQDSQIDFRLGRSDPNPLPLSVWRRACREAGRHLPDSGYGDPQGDATLRAQIALYLGRTRAMCVRPEQILITAGAGQAIERIAQVILRPGTYAGLEDPGYPRAAESFRRFGARLVPVPVDDDGLDTGFLFRLKSRPALLHVTPAHQYPLGSRLSSARRYSLIRWARDRGSLIIENDYDGEFRYSSPPLPALAALAGFENIAYVGTFSKVLSPAIRLGFIVAGDQMINALAGLVARMQDSMSIVTQRIMEWMIQSGELERHIRRTRRHYAIRRLTMLRALSQVPGVASVTGQSAGLHVVVELRREIAPQLAHERLRTAGVLVDRVADYQLKGRVDERLLMAYGHLSDMDISRGTQKIGIHLGSL